MRTAVDNLYLYDPQFEAGAKRFAGELGGSTATAPITSATDIGNRMKDHSNVRFLVFDTHGSPGKIWLPNNTNFEGVDFMIYARYGNFLSRNAQVLFLGCNVGEGPAGDAFLGDVGKFLLRGKGGTVGATTVSNITFQIGSFSSEAYMMPLSFGRMKVKRYSDKGNEVGSITVDRHGFKR